MTKLVWDKTGEHFYETGVDHCVLYIRNSNGSYDAGVAWNGITSISESPSGAEASAQYADNQKYLTLISAEEFGATVEAFTYPDEFDACNGEEELVTGVRIGQQKRATFGLAYRTKSGDDVNGQDKYYKLHLIYGATAAPSERQYSTVNESPEAMTFSWELSSNPETVTNYKPTSLITIDSRQVDPQTLTAIEDILFGSDSEDARLPLPDELISLLQPGADETMASLSKGDKSNL